MMTPPHKFTIGVGLRFIRFPNLLIVIFTQFLIQYAILVPFFGAARLSPALPFAQFCWFVCSTVIIAATGYIINDILDADIDRINKPDRLVVTRYLSKSQAWYWYCALVVIGFGISLYLALFVNNLLLLLIYPIAIGLLAAYSFYLKKQPLAGNVIVSIFCAFVPGVVLFAERHTYFSLRQDAPAIANEVLVLVGGYVLFAFVSTLFREIVKDMEDVEGDRQYGCRTLPIVLGISKTRTIALLIAGIFIIFLVQMLHILLIQQALTGLFAVGLLLVLPLTVLLYLLLTAETTADFHRVSTGAKLLMLNGLLVLIVILMSQ
ncbi:MAG: geranylgeranylglycerol-phosphate geranylgeranyltransferase [Bacteroidota bacterium]